MKLLISTFFFLLITFNIQFVVAQDFQPPKKYSLDKESDYAKYEKDVINCVDWLEATPIKQQPEKRKEVNAFLVTWITGSPNVSISLRAEIIGMLSDKGELLSAFMGGWTKFALQNPEFSGDEVKCNMAGLRSVIKVYKANKNAGVEKDKEIDKVIKLDERGKLESWVSDKLKH